VNQSDLRYVGNCQLAASVGSNEHRVGEGMSKGAIAQRISQLARSMQSSEAVAGTRVGAGGDAAQGRIGRQGGASPLAGRRREVFA
jgi:hypothetical protein